VIVALDLLVLATILAFSRKHAVAAWLLAPYLVWIAFATALNFAIWRLN
jgi:tryptophan-rich sensory protein